MKTEDLFAALEPAAEAALSPEHAALCSIAISLKRIADALEPRNEYGETPFEAIGGGNSSGPAPMTNAPPSSGVVEAAVQPTTGGGGDDLHFVEALVDKLPAMAAVWSEETRGAWYECLATAAGIVRRSTPITDADREWALKSAREIATPEALAEIRCRAAAPSSETDEAAFEAWLGKYYSSASSFSAIERHAFLAGRRSRPIPDEMAAEVDQRGKLQAYHQRKRATQALSSEGPGE